MAAKNVRIIKVGGSLFDAPWLAERLNQWIDRQTPATNIFVAGGGPLVGSLRDLDRLHQIGEVPAHWLCVRAMGVTARLLVDFFTDAALIDTIESAKQLISSRPEKLSVFDPAPLLTTAEAILPGTALPHGWSVTSDSIAARLAEILGAAELVLLKSTLPNADSVDQWTKQGYVDGFFPTIARQLPRVRCVNLRDETLPEVIFENSAD